MFQAPDFESRAGNAASVETVKRAAASNSVYKTITENGAPPRSNAVQQQSFLGFNSLTVGA
jgi:hypothetical protein